MRGSLIKFLLDPGMDRQFVDRVAVINLHEFRPFFHLVLPDPGLYRNKKFTIPHRSIRKHLIKKAVQIIRVEKKSRPFLLCRDRSGRTPEIQIDLPVSHLQKFLRCKKKIPCPVCQDLRNDRYPGIVFRQYIPHLLHTHPLFRSRRQKRGKIFLHTAKIFVVQISVWIGCDPLKRGKIDMHVLCSSYRSFDFSLSYHILLLQANFSPFLWKTCPISTIL